MKKLEITNYLLQFLFVRLTRCQEKLITGFKLQSFSMDDNGGSVAGRIDDYEIHTWYSIQGFILPLTGWINGFVYLNKPFFIKITGVKISK